MSTLERLASGRRAGSQASSPMSLLPAGLRYAGGALICSLCCRSVGLFRCRTVAWRSVAINSSRRALVWGPLRLAARHPRRCTILLWAIRGRFWRRYVRRSSSVTLRGVLGAASRPRALRVHHRRSFDEPDSPGHSTDLSTRRWWRPRVRCSFDSIDAPCSFRVVYLRLPGHICKRQSGHDLRFYSRLESTV